MTSDRFENKDKGNRFIMDNTIFLKDFEKAVELARLAPSSHNSQPWLVNLMTPHEANRFLEASEKINPDNTDHVIGIHFDNERLLNALPKLHDEMYISCGIFTEHLTLCLSDIGYQCSIYLIDNPPLIGLIKVGFNPSEKAPPNKNTKDILSNRITHRGPYLPDSISAQLLESAKKEAKNLGCRFHLFQQDKEITFLSGLVRKHAGFDFSHRAAWAETYRHIHFNHLKPAENGFYLHHLFGKVSFLFATAFRWIFHPKNHWLYTRLGLHNTLAKGLADLVSQTPHLFALSVKEESHRSFWQSGLAIGKLSVIFQKTGFSIHPVSVLLQNPEPRAAMAALVDDERKLTFIARLGKPLEASTHSPRRSVDSIIRTHGHPI